MNCHRARMALVERDLGTLTLGFERGLADHLAHCAACRESEGKDLLLLDRLAAFRRAPQPQVDVTRSVMLCVGELPQIERSTVPIREIAWAAASAVAAAVGLVAWISPQAAWLKQAGGLATTGITAMLSAAYSTVGALKSLLVLPWRVLGALLEAAQPLLDELARFEPVAFTAISMGLLSMMLTIAWVVGNDLRRPNPVAWRKDG